MRKVGYVLHTAVTHASRALFAPKRYSEISQTCLPCAVRAKASPQNFSNVPGVRCSRQNVTVKCFKHTSRVQFAPKRNFIKITKKAVKRFSVLKSTGCSCFVGAEEEFSVVLESVLTGHEGWVYGVHWHPSRKHGW